MTPLPYKQPPATIDRTGKTNVTAALNAWRSALGPNNVRTEYRGDAIYQVDESMHLWPKGGVGNKVKGHGVRFIRDPAAPGAGWQVGGIGGQGNVAFDLRVTGGNTQAGPDGPFDVDRESHHCLYFGGEWDLELFDVRGSCGWGDDIYFDGQELPHTKGGPVKNREWYRWCERVNFHDSWLGPSGRQVFTGQGIEDSTFERIDATGARRTTIECEPNAQAFNGMNNCTFRDWHVGPGRFGLLANNGGGQCDGNRLLDFRIARSPWMSGSDGATPADAAEVKYPPDYEPGRRKGWEFRGWRYLLPTDALRSIPPIDPAKPPHFGSKTGAVMEFSRFDDLVIEDCGPFYVDYGDTGRNPLMVLASLRDCRRYSVTGSDPLQIFGGGGPRQYEARGTGIAVRADALSTPA